MNGDQVFESSAGPPRVLEIDTYISGVSLQRGSVPPASASPAIVVWALSRSGLIRGLDHGSLLLSVSYRNSIRTCSSMDCRDSVAACALSL